MLNKFKILSLFIFLNTFGSAQDAGKSNAISDPVLLRRDFIDAVEANDLRRVQEIVPTHLRPDEEVFGGAPSLVYAVMFNSEPIVRYLLEQGARSNIENTREDRSPLAMALHDRCRNIDIAALLLENGAMPSQRDKATILRDAISENQPNLLRLSLKYFSHEDLNMCLWNNSSNFSKAIDKDCPEVARLMVESDKLDLFGDMNIGAFAGAFEKGFYRVVDSVLERIKNKELFFNKVIRYKSYFPTKELAEYLIKSVNYDKFLVQSVVFALGLYDCNSNSDYKEMAEKFKPYDENEGLRFLHNLLSCDVEAVEGMLEKNKEIGNALFYIANEYMSPIDIAIYKMDTSLLKVLLPRIGQVSKIEVARVFNLSDWKKAIEIFKIILESGASCNFTVEHYSKLFIKAVDVKDAEMVKFLIRKGVPVDYDNGRALKIAAVKGSEAIVDFLLQNGARVRLDYCLENSIIDGNFKIAQILLKAGADINANNGKLLKYFVDCKHINNLERLEFALRNGADVKYLKEFKIPQDGYGSDRIDLERLRLLISFGFEPDSQTIAYMKSCE